MITSRNYLNKQFPYLPRMYEKPFVRLFQFYCHNKYLPINVNLHFMESLMMKIETVK